MGALVAAALISVGQPCPTSTPPTPGWSVEYRWVDRTPRADGSRRLWVGLRNDSPSERAVCLDSIWYSHSNPDGGVSGGSLIPMSPHGCRDLWQFNLLPPSQAVFVLGTIHNAATLDVRPLSISVAATSYDVRGENPLDIHAVFREASQVEPCEPKHGDAEQADEADKTR